MRKTVKIDREEHHRLVTAERVLSKEVEDLQDRNQWQANKLREITADRKRFKDIADKQEAAIQHAYKFKRALHALWHPSDALMNKVSLRSRWPELYNVLDKELK